MPSCDLKWRPEANSRLSLMKLAVITFTCTTDADQGTAAGPEALLRAGLIDWLRAQGHDAAGPFHVGLTSDEQAAYGVWNKIGLANAHLARLVSDAARKDAFPLILESNCYAAIGALAGLQKSAGLPSPRLGMVWIDAHGDCNTPETTLSGWLSGMPVAIGSGMCLDRLRRQSGLDPAIAARNVVMVCVRANDPLEQELIDQSGIEMVPVADIQADCHQLRTAMEQLSSSVDRIYVHLDVDALDASEVASMWVIAPGGPSRSELAAALKIIMAYAKVAAFGIADINPERDADGDMIQAALAVIKGGLAGTCG
jgi:arginase